jgi:hypothetical protein
LDLDLAMRRLASYALGGPTGSTDHVGAGYHCYYSIALAG